MTFTVTILALTLNEREGVEKILPKIKKSWFNQLLIIDGGSTDGTVEWCKKKNYQVLIQDKKGIRNAYFKALKFIKSDLILTISPDGNCDVSRIPIMINHFKNGNYDLVIGSRYLNGEKSDDDDLITKFGNWFFTFSANIFFNGKLTDVMVIFRLFKKDLIYELGLNKELSYRLPEKLFRTIISWEPLMTVRAMKKKKKIGEILAHEYSRIGGERKLQIVRWGLAYYFQFLSEFIKKLLNKK